MALLQVAATLSYFFTKTFYMMIKYTPPSYKYSVQERIYVFKYVYAFRRRASSRSPPTA